MDNRNGRHLGLQSTGSHSLGHPQFGLSRMQLIENLENLGRISLAGKIRPVRRTGDKHRALDPGQAEMESSASLLDLAWTLQAKRTELPFRKSFTGATKEQLLENMRSAVLTVEEKPTAAFGTRSQDLGQSPKILGVFTGQGAQWPSMGAELLRTSRMFVESIQRLEESLGELTDAPEWSLHQELSAAGSDSRVHLAEISQPLCTAVQVALVDLLHVAGAQFCAVIGPLVW
ncbi:hypothetical protein BDV30DRAFT_7012 [Aspergillus minisclerotigenes]|uniref:Malonyl-CoA:ACP transacylase (MAT) domain-containing protein n=1 Tax=Aspergillus minisclerotigenes TaxID=656917 RepID=A0A5N6JGZ3_9EURO|nr:hypothetical protein BDV30DRAFT_7012 [Aspergillus minisclerotigenes]